MDSNYPINELAKKAAVSVRTIRFYIDEGLLPFPQVHGRYTVYSDEYLERLELIRILKNRFLPLKEIRARLLGLSPEDVKEAIALERGSNTGSASQPSNLNHTGGNPSEASALDYVNRLRVSRTESSPPPNLNLPAPASPNIRFKKIAENRESYPTREELWERVRLAPGVELHIQKPLESGIRQKLQILIDYAQQLFNL